MKLSYLQGQVQNYPLCKGNRFATLKTNDRYGMDIVTVGCETCGLIQTNPRPSEEALSSFYQNDYRTFYQNTVKPSEAYIRENNKHTRMTYTVAYVTTIIAGLEVRKVLGIGCSEGPFFSALVEAGFKGELYGVEPNPEFARFAEQKTGARVFPSLDALQGEFDLIVLSHVFEHFLRPDEFLQKIKSNLSQNGVLYIDVPDASEYSSLADLHIAHLYHFTTRTLEALAQANGFRVIECEQHRPPHHPRSVRVVLMKDDTQTEGARTTTAGRRKRRPGTRFAVFRHSNTFSAGVWPVSSSCAASISASD